MSALAMGTLFPPEIEQEVFSKVKGHSSLAKMARQEPLKFTGKDVFVLSFDSDVSVVGENADKPAGDATLTSVQIRPVKVVYQSRVSDEFLTASDEYRIDVLSKFAEGFAAKLGAGLDKMAIHGIDPATGSASAIIGTNNFDAQVTNTITYGVNPADQDLNDAIALVEAGDYVCDGAILAPVMRAAIAALDVNGAVKYPDFNFGATPERLGNMGVDSNATVSAASSDDKALVGDFSAFKWGIARELPLEVIEYGDPDNTGKDLKGYNQILLRSEAYIGWGILDKNAFAIVKS